MHAILTILASLMVMGITSPGKDLKCYYGGMSKNCLVEQDADIGKVKVEKASSKLKYTHDGKPSPPAKGGNGGDPSGDDGVNLHQWVKPWYVDINQREVVLCGGCAFIALFIYILLQKYACTLEWTGDHYETSSQNLGYNDYHTDNALALVSGNTGKPRALASPVHMRNGGAVATMLTQPFNHGPKIIYREVAIMKSGINM